MWKIIDVGSGFITCSLCGGSHEGTAFRDGGTAQFLLFFFSLENIIAITILWGGIIKRKLAYRLVLVGREKERWVKIFKIMCSYATQRVACRNLSGVGLPNPMYTLTELMDVS